MKALLMRIAAIVITSFSLLLPAVAQFELVPMTGFGTNGDGSIRPDERPYLTGDGNRYQRGMAYNPTTDRLIIVNRSPIGSETINVIDAATGSDVSTLNTCCPVTGGSANFLYNQIAITDDGAIYVGNLVTTTGNLPFNLYRWASETNDQTLVYQGDPRNGNTNAPGVNTRWGDTMAVRGSGTNTEVIIASQNGTLVAVFRPTDEYMTNFSCTTVTTDVPAGGLGYGLAFGTSNTFWGKDAASEGRPLYRMTYDLTASNATTVQSYPLTAFPGRVGPIAVNLASNLLAGIEMVPEPDRVRLYDISTLTNVVLQDRREFPTNIANNIFAGAVAFGTNGGVYALDSDNGILALQIQPGTNSLSPVIFYSSPSAIIPVTSNMVFNVGADGTWPLAYQWRKDGANIAGATGSNYTITNAQTGNSGSYSVVVTNSYGSVTSGVTVLSVLGSIGTSLVYDPFAYGVGSDVAGQGGWLLNSGSSATVEAGNLDVLGLAASAGNRAVLPSSATSSTRLPIGQYTNGSIFFSCAFRLNTIGTSVSSETVAGFAQGTGTTFAPKINIQGDGVGNTYQIGLYKGGGTTLGSLATNLFTTNDTVFIVARYTINPGALNDTCDLWLNPAPSTFASVTPPTPSVGPIGASSGTDLAPLDRLFLRVGQSSIYQGRTFDEIRVGFDWASVTPEASPVLGIGQSGTNAIIFWPAYTGTNFYLQRIRQLDDPDGWETLGGTPTVQGTNNTVTVPIVDRRLYRLREQAH